MSQPVLWIPGPTEVRAPILAECARPMIGHRGPEMSALHERIDPPLRQCFGLAAGSSAKVAVHTASASGLMESALAGAGARVLALVNGAFSMRFAEIASALGKQVTVLCAENGACVEPQTVAAALAQSGPFDAVTVVANETSTGVRTPLAPLQKLLAGHPGTLLLVDVVTLLAGAPVDFDANGLDFAFAGSQKALALPPGISVACASARYLAQAREHKLRGWYLDPVRIFEGHEKRATPATPCIPLYYALARQLEDISQGLTLHRKDRAKTGAEAWRARYEEHARMQQVTEAWAQSNGLDLLPPPELCSPTISCIRAGSLPIEAFLKSMRERGHQLGEGYGDLKRSTFRIGHMGDHPEAELSAMLQIADDVIRELA